MSTRPAVGTVTVAGPGGSFGYDAQMRTVVEREGEHFYSDWSNVLSADNPWVVVGGVSGEFVAVRW